MYIENEIEHIDDQIEYGLLRAHNTMGGMTPSIHCTFIVKDNKFIQEECIYTPALVKSACEVIDNSIDEAIRCRFELGNIIKIEVKDNKDIIVEDNGRGIPTKKDKKGNPQFVIALTNVQAGSNFRDDENNNKKGTNGIGSSMAFILSSKASCITKTSDTYGVLTTSNNTRNIDYSIKDKKHRKTGTKITLTPDYKRFNVQEFDEIHQKVLYTYIVNQAVCYPMISFYYNNIKINASNFEDYIKYYDDEAVVCYSDDIVDIAIYPTKEFKFTYFINGLNVYDGGDALDYIVNRINDGLKSCAPKKFSKLTNSNFKNRLGYIVNYKNRTNLDWNGQTKQKCNSTYSKLKSPKIDWSSLTKILYKNKVIISPILELFTIQEDYEARKLLKDLVKPNKKIKIEKYKPAIYEKKYLMVSEGNSAGGAILSATGRDNIGAYPLKGKPLNCYRCDITKIKKNQEIKDILEIMGIDLSKDLNNYETTYKNLLCATDADVDGSNILMLLLTFFMKYYPEFVKEGRFKRLLTPVIVVYEKNIPVLSCFNLDDYTIYQKLNKQHEAKYKKGLASLTDIEYTWLFKDGVEQYIETIEYDEECKDVFDSWMKTDPIDRKTFLLGQELDLFNV